MITIFEVTTFEQEGSLVDTAELLKLKFEFLEEDEGFGIMLEINSENSEDVARLIQFYGRQLAPRSHKRRAKA